VTAPRARPPRRWAQLWDLAAEVLPPWVVCRVIVGAALAVAHFDVDRTHPRAGGVVARVRQGLLGWDAGWYEAIARHGYVALGHASLRFFPLVPVVVRAVAVLPGVSDGTALIVVANLASLVATALLVLLVRRETGDGKLARRTIWLLSLAPPAFTYVMGYAEAPLLVFTVGCFLALRSPRGPRWWWAAAMGYLAALTRPLGVVLVLAVAVELVRWWVRTRGPGRLGGVVALLAPLAGLSTFLAWSGEVLGDALLPLRVQTQAGHHGGLSDPFGTLVHDATGLVHHHVGTALHVPWAVVAVALLVVCWCRLPASYSLFATGVVIAALSGTNLDSFERYALSAFPLVWGASLLTASRRVEIVVLSLSGAALLAYALLAFLNIYVP
jgi:hypothetical protein